MLFCFVWFDLVFTSYVTYSILDVLNFCFLNTAKGRTNYELHPENYALRDGVAQTMTLFKPRLVTVHRPTCLVHQQQSTTVGALKQSPMTTPNRVNFHDIIFLVLLST